MVYELNEPDDLPEEVYGVYSAMIDQMYGQKNYVMIRQETDTTLFRPGCRDLMHSDTTSLKEITLLDYLQNNKTSSSLGDSFSDHLQIRLITREELSSYENWERFHENNPQAEGVLIFRLPGFNADSTQALFEYSWLSDDHSNRDHLLYMECHQNQWCISAHESYPSRLN